MLEFNEFKDQVQNDILVYLGDDYKDADVRVIQVVKPNDTILEGLNILRKDERVAPTIYLNSFYDEYREGADLEDIMREIASIITRHSSCPFNMSEINDIAAYEKVKEKIRIKLVNKDNNPQYLENKPYTPVAEDLVAVYYIDLAESSAGQSSITINNGIMNMYNGITLEDIHKQALKNLDKTVRFTDMLSVLSDLGGESLIDDIPANAENQMYILTTSDKTNGASAILCERVMRDIAIMIGEDYFVIPSSCAELILVPKTDGIDSQNLRTMLWEVNEACVSPEDRLSDNVYIYDYDKHSLVIAA